MKALIANYLSRDDIGSVSGIFINLAQKRIEREHNWKCMEKRQTTSTSDAYISIPPRFKEHKSLMIFEGGRYYSLMKTSYDHALSVYPLESDNRGMPLIFATVQATNEFLVRPTPDKVYNYDLYYYQYTAELTEDTDTNWWTDVAWDVLLYASLGESAPYLMADERLITWKALYDVAVARLKSVERAEEFSGAQFIRPGGVVY